MSEPDLVGSILETTRLRGRVFCQSIGRAPWGLRFPAAPHAIFHLVTEGTAVALVGQGHHVLSQGDLALFPHGSAHSIVDRRGSPRIDLDTWLASARPTGGPFRVGAARGPETRVVCGVYEFDGLGAEHPILRLLPPFVHLSAARARAIPDMSETLIALAREHETPRHGSTVVVSRLLDVLFVRIVRSWAESEPPRATGFVGALRDPTLARALSAMHGDLAREWTVETIARVARTSRATLGRRFVAEVGSSPLAYLAHARLHESARQLRIADDGLAQIAARVGYASEFAFNRAFRRAFAVPPGEYRRRARAGTG